MRRILVIKHGAFGDIVLATGPFRAIRDAHAGDAITLLTASRFATFLRSSPYFNDIWIDDRPEFWRVAAWWRLFRRLRGLRFDRVYDLQTSDRSALIFRVLACGRRVEWSGIARGCSHPHANPRRDFLHTIERQAEQLAAAGIASTPPPNLDWVRSDVDRFALPPRYALIAPGGAAHRPEKRWPAERFAAVAGELHTRGIAPVLIGSAGERDLLAGIAGTAGAIDLAGRTELADIVGLARGAALAVGNDTGPMHAAAVSGCPVIVLFSAASDPAITAPRGPRVDVLRCPRLAELTVEEVGKRLAAWL
ncbi:MAG: glycosyltransferase family 9 protein [Alphaproteobacteria bacterium]|nr:glycosyltransferase family 9 protein [Alphaproteobacteria bacterium]